ncbi:MAG: hypothetical protein Q3999_08035 [Buchananella hordeovulneris]|nr:hypothetical protein [Buchananella hordeovulneris]
MTEQPRLTRRELRARERAAERELRAQGDAELAAAGVAARERLAAQGRGEFAADAAAPTATAAPVVPSAPTQLAGAPGAAAPRNASAAAAPLAGAAAAPSSRRDLRGEVTSRIDLGEKGAPAPAGTGATGASAAVGAARAATQAGPAPATLAPAQPAAQPAVQPGASAVTQVVAQGVAQPGAVSAPGAADVEDDGEATTAFSPDEIVELKEAPRPGGAPAAAPNTPSPDGPRVPSRRSLRERRVEREVAWEGEQEQTARRRVVTSVPRSSGVRTVDSTGHLTGVIPTVQVSTGNDGDPATLAGLSFTGDDGQAPLPPTGSLQAVTGAAAAALAADAAGETQQDEADLSAQINWGPMTAPPSPAEAQESPTGGVFAPVVEAAAATEPAAEVAHSLDSALQGEPSRAGFSDLVSGAVDPTTPGGTNAVFDPATSPFAPVGAEEGETAAEAPAGTSSPETSENDTHLPAGERVASPYGAGFTTGEAHAQVGNMQADLRRLAGPLPTNGEESPQDAAAPRNLKWLWILVAIAVAAVAITGIVIGMRKAAGVADAPANHPVAAAHVETTNWSM